jgi:hypothetical protein
MKLAVDEYRVSLFKKKIRIELPEVGGLRLYRSKGRCHLVINMWRYYGNEDEVGRYISSQFKRSGIEFKEDRYSWGTQKLHSICVPIDQAALPERKRDTRHAP